MPAGRPEQHFHQNVPFERRRSLLSNGTCGFVLVLWSPIFGCLVDETPNGAHSAARLVDRALPSRARGGAIFQRANF